jgi:hypothetical protein
LVISALRPPDRSALPYVRGIRAHDARQDSEQQRFECTACGAAMDEDEIDAAQQVPAPRQQPGIERKHSRGETFTEVA